MKILILSDSNSPHTIRWVKSLIQKKCSIRLFSFHSPDTHLYKDDHKILIDSLNLPREKQLKNETSLYKLIYLKSLLQVKKIIKEFKPDILHAHYASSYGMIGALTGFHPFIISVWGSDIYNFPNHSMVHRTLMKFNLSKADKILSTSRIMKLETQKYTNKEILVTPFGVDTEKFRPQKKNYTYFKGDEIVIGTIKSLEKKYGIDYLIRAFAIIRKKFSNQSLKLIIVGQGTQQEYLKSLVNELKIQNDTIFTGYIYHDKIPEYHNMLDIYVAASIEDSESFGVAVLEASACGKPVVVSNVGGLPEVVENGMTGFIVEKQNPEALAEVLEKLISNSGLRTEMGNNGRNKILKEFSWIESVDYMISIYNEILAH